MVNLGKNLLVVMCSLLLVAQADARHTQASMEFSTTYTNGINESGWQSSGSVFECSLTHDVPYYGTAVFSTRAGESSEFYLSAISSRFKAGKGRLVSRAPVWKGKTETTLGNIGIKKGLKPLWLNSNYAERMMSELFNGMEVEVINEAWYEGAEKPPMRLAISNIGFRAEYQKYQMCLAGLLPNNFDQLRRTALYFEPNVPESSSDLNPYIRRKLENILLLVKHDKGIQHFYVDGHASAPGDRQYNLDLSKRRAELVRDYLTQGGISADKITLRWHGERYPVASNNTAAGRAKNRRVTIRLEREAKEETMPLAQQSNDGV